MWQLFPPRLSSIKHQNRAPQRVLQLIRREENKEGNIKDSGESVSSLFLLALSSAQFYFVLLTEAISDGEEVPTTLLVHIPDVGLLTGVFRVRFVDQMHQEEPARTREEEAHD